MDAPDRPAVEISELDWYAFDVAATRRLHRLRMGASSDETSNRYREQAPSSRRRRRSGHRSDDGAGETYPTPDSPAVEQGDLLIMRGTEIPPWAQ